VWNRQQIAAVAAAFVAGELDPLTACRRILGLVGDREHWDPDIVTIVGIDSETDHLPDPERRHLWDPAALREKDAEIDAYFKRAGPSLREACEHLVSKWSDAGMTVNERLYSAGLLEDFDAAVERGDKDEVIRLLQAVHLSPQDAQWSADTLFANFARYGYPRRK
jgi:hypothetical protein